MNPYPSFPGYKFHFRSDVILGKYVEVLKARYSEEKEKEYSIDWKVIILSCFLVVPFFVMETLCRTPSDQLHTLSNWKCINSEAPMFFHRDNRRWVSWKKYTRFYIRNLGLGWALKFVNFSSFRRLKVSCKFLKLVIFGNFCVEFKEKIFVSYTKSFEREPSQFLWGSSFL